MAQSTGPVFSLGAGALKDHNTSTCKHQMGGIVQAAGHLYQYVKAAAAISANEIVVLHEAYKAWDTPTGVDNTGDRATGRYPSITDTGLAATAGEYVGGYLYIDAGTGAGEMKRIRKNTDTQIWFEAIHPDLGEADTFTTTPVIADSDFTIIMPFVVKKAVADTMTQPVIGTAPAAFTSGYYGFICVSGVVLAGSGTDGGASALAAGVFVTSGDNTAGQCTGLPANETIDDVHIFGTALHAAADDQAAPIMLHGNCI